MRCNPLPHIATATPARIAIVAILCAAPAGHQLFAQQSQPKTSTAASPTERRGVGYGVGRAPATAPAPTVETPQAAQATQAAPAPVPPPVDSTQLSTGVHLDEIMTLREWNSTGVAKLAPEERAALEAWIAKYRYVVLDSAVRASESSAAQPGAASNGEVAAPAGSAFSPPSPPAFTPGAPQAGSLAQVPAYPSPTPPAPAYAYPQAPGQGYPPTAPQNYQPPAAPQGYAPGAYPANPQSPGPATPPAYPATPTPAYPPAAPAPAVGANGTIGLSILDVRGGNRFVTLSDGTMWDVYPGDRTEVGVWRTQDPAYVRLGTTTVGGGYDREIVNASRNVLVRVKFVGQGAN